MKISNFKEAPLLRAYLLINQEKNKKVFKSIQPEISKMTEIFGPDFDLNLHLILFNDIDFKDLKGLQKSKDRKVQYFLQDFPQYIEHVDFIENFSRILMHTKNTGTTSEIFNGLNKQCKLSMENQMKLIICFIMSDTERYQEEAKNILLEKCRDVFREKKINALTESTVNTLLTILDTMTNDEESQNESEENDENSQRKQIEEYFNYFMSFEDSFNSVQTSGDDIKQISDIEKMLDTGKEDPVELEKLFIDLGPFIIGNRINIFNYEMINTEIDVERLGNFILYMLNHSTVKLTEELKELNKMFLDSLIKTGYNQNANANINKEDYKNLLDENVNKDLSWNLDAVYKIFKKNIDNMDVNQILNSLDDPSFCIKDKKTFDFLIEILEKLNILKEDKEDSKDKFFKNLIFTKWNNEINQIEFIDFMINNEEVNENSDYGLQNYKGSKIPEDMDTKILQRYNNNSNIKNKYLINNWKILDLIEILLQLSKGDFYNSVKEIFKWPIQNIKEILALALVNITHEPDEFLYDYLTYKVIPEILKSKNANQELIDEIWNLNRNLIISILAKMWDDQPDLSNLANIFEIIITKFPDNLLMFVNSKYYNFCVNLAIYASKRDYLNLKQWLEERINKVEDEFIEAILNYINKNLISQCTGNSNGILEKAQLTSESLAIILESIIKSCDTNKLSQKTKKMSKEVYNSIFELFEEIQSQSNNMEEIDRESNQILNSMFNGEITVDSIINKLINYNNSPNQKENEKYVYLIHCIFDEYKFYHQYPEKQIKKIAELFGKIINNNVIDGILLTVALKYILEGIKTGKGTMYMFGTIALSQFIGKISLWPNYMNYLIDIPQIQNEKELYQKLLKQFNESKKKDKGINSENSRGEEGESLLESGDKNIDMATGREYSLDKDDRNIAKQYDKLKNKLLGPAISYQNISKNNNNESQNQISEEIITKIQFIFGTFGTPNFNLQDKIKELKSIFKEEKIIKWFSQYFVNSLIADEKNIQYFPKYYEVFDQLKNKELHKEIIKSTIKLISKNVSVNIDSLSSESKSKETLKNLGLWLGEYKISKDRPILAKDLDFKSLIINACQNGKLNLVVPFICCVFKSCPNSKVFRVSNPWISSILNLLVELHGNQAVDQQIKEEIKNLFKILKTDMNQFSKTKELEKYPIKSNLTYYGHDVDKDFFCKKISELDDYINNLLGIFNSEPNLISRLSRKNSTNNNSNNENNSYNQNDVIKILSEVLSNGIQDIIPDIIERNVKTAVVTAICLVNKDFMFEKSEEKYMSALEKTMKSLLTSLSNMNARELLKQNINTEFNKILNSKNLSNKTIDKIKNQPNSEFLLIGLNYIQNFVSKEAMKILHENASVKEVLEKRRQNDANNMFIDKKHLEEYKKIIKNLPEPLQPNEKCITEEELKIYDYFDVLTESMNSKEDIGKNSFLNTVYRILKEVLDKPVSSKSICSNYDICMKNIQNVSYTIDNNYEDDDQQLVCLEKIISESKINDRNLETKLALNTLDYAINSIKNGNILWLNVYSHILKGWISLKSEISEEITTKLLEYEDIFIRYKYELYHNFIKKKIINSEVLEKHFIEILNNNCYDLLARNLLKKIITKAKNSHSYYYDNNSNTYYALFSNKSQIASHILGFNKNPILLSLKKNDQISDQSKEQANDQNNEQNIEQNNNLLKFCTMLLELLTKYYTKNNNENQDVIGVIRRESKLEKNENFTEKNLNNIILMICELCIKGELESPKNKSTLCFPDYAALNIYIIFYIKENIDKLKKFRQMIICLVNFFHKDYMISEKNLNQRAYFRLFYNLIYFLNKNSSNETILDSDHKRINYLCKISEFLEKISPSKYPIFAMGWLELISCNLFITNFLEPPLHMLHSKKKGANEKNEKYEKYEKYLLLLLELLTYLDSLNEKIISDYNYVIFLDKVYKFFFLLSNSYPEFVSSYYYQLITSLSGETSNFIQLKNIILSAAPRNITIPEIEFSLSNKDDNDRREESNSPGETNSNNSNLNSSIKKTAIIMFDTGNFLEKKGIKSLIDKYINEENETYLSSLINKIESLNNESEQNKVINQIVIYWSQSKHKHYLSEKSIKSKDIIFKFYLYLLNNLNKDLRNMMINGILNSLRFPCVQTMSYSFLLQELLFEIKNEEIKEHILNNLLIRLLYKPLPWGIRHTMIDLYKKDKFQKMVKPFVEKYKLSEVLVKIVNNCKDKTLVNYVHE